MLTDYEPLIESEDACPACHQNLKVAGNTYELCEGCEENFYLDVMLSALSHPERMNAQERLEYVEELRRAFQEEKAKQKTCV